MPGLDVDEAEFGEELANERQHVVGDVLALRAADEEGRFLEADGGGVLEWEVAHVGE